MLDAWRNAQVLFCILKGKIMFKKVCLMALTLLAVAQLSACNTVSGIGKDVKKVGEVVEGAGKK
jgi:predicted small secreted protein